MYVGDKYLTVSHLKRQIENHLKDTLLASNEKAINQPTLNTNDVILPGCRRIGKSPDSNYAYFIFEDDVGYENGKSILCSVQNKGKRWVDVLVEASDLKNFTKNSSERENHANRELEKKRQLETTQEDDSSSMAVSPWADIPYEQQIKRKRRHCMRVLKRIASQVIPGEKKVESEKSNCYSVLEVIPSVKPERYRNRVDYSIGSRDDSESVAPKPCVGFNAGAYKNGYRKVTKLSPCVITPEVLQNIAGEVELWMQSWWKNHPLVLKGYDKETHHGFWRRLSMRISADDQIMIALQTMSSSWLHKALVDNEECSIDSTALFAVLQEDFAQVFSSMCTSLQWQEFDGISNAAPSDLPYKSLHGPLTIVDHVDGKGFQISANSFFQVNTSAMELLVRRLYALPFIHKNTVLLDICSGTGLIGLSLHDRVHRVIGVEMTASAVDDARENASNMHATNVHYICDKVENCYEQIQSAIYETMHSTETALEGTEVVAIVDPPRSGLHKNVIKWLRRLKLINKLVYISCDQSALVRDAVLLLKPPSIAYPGDPFNGTSSFAVDFFPHTPHVEQVFIMERQ
ncbi:S-adenosylmethionine-dependent methyltransferase [Perkinsela sp. CCAP 1560/4]|nr:S-adenosylmethionine-dependent methyltransferase [Perkinsela sp. CCAP 1560/4]|eukprot:KNH09258.1 S-adenosylmethionine-dependent methyltransferase [Perkinsela sp. CCAP 1560/4]